MTAPFTNIDEKVGAALTALLVALKDDIAVDAAQFKQGVENSELEAPCVVCFVESYDEKILDSGIYEVKAVVRVRSQAQQTQAAIHRARVATVCDRLRQDDVAARLTALTSDFHCYQVVFGQGAANVDDTSWSFEQRLTIFCQPSDNPDA